MSQNYYNIGIIYLQDKSLILTNAYQEKFDNEINNFLDVIKDRNLTNSFCKHCGSLNIHLDNRSLTHPKLMAINIIVLFINNMFLNSIFSHLL